MYKDDYEVNINSIENIQYSDFYDDQHKPFIVSDTRFFKYKGNLYLNITMVNYAQNEYGYTAQIAIASLHDRRIVRINFEGMLEVEKNYSFFEYDEKLFFIRGLWDSATHIYEVDPVCGEGFLAYEKGYVSQHDAEASGSFRTTSSPVNRGELNYVCLHSHTDTLPHTYKCGMMAFENSPPFDVKHVSNVPLFDIQGTEIIYPIGLSNGVENNDEFIIGFGLADYEKMDLVSITHNELREHFSNDVTFEYPAKLYPMQQTAYTPAIKENSKTNLMSIIKNIIGGNG